MNAIRLKFGFSNTLFLYFKIKQLYKIITDIIRCKVKIRKDCKNEVSKEDEFIKYFYIPQVVLR